MYKMPGAGVGVAGGGVGTLAATGADIGWWLAVGVLLVLLGTIALIAVHRRNRRLSQARRLRGGPSACAPRTPAARCRRFPGHWTMWRRGTAGWM